MTKPTKKDIDTIRLYQSNVLSQVAAMKRLKIPAENRQTFYRRYHGIDMYIRRSVT